MGRGRGGHRPRGRRSGHGHGPAALRVRTGRPDRRRGRPGRPGARRHRGRPRRPGRRRRCARGPGSRRAGRPDRPRLRDHGRGHRRGRRPAARDRPSGPRPSARPWPTCPSSARRRPTTGCRRAVRARYDRLAEAVGKVDGLETAWAGLEHRVARGEPPVGPAGRRTTRPCSMPRRRAGTRTTPRRWRRSTAPTRPSPTPGPCATRWPTVDVAVLDEWLDRNAAYDVALRDLYAALDGVGGRVTDDVRDAIDAEQAAKERLPADSRGLILIMSEIGRGGMNPRSSPSRRPAARWPTRSSRRPPTRPPASRPPPRSRAPGATLRPTSRVHRGPLLVAPPRPRTGGSAHRAASCRHRSALGRHGRRPGHPDRRGARFRRPARRARPPGRRRAQHPGRLPRAHRQALLHDPGRRRESCPPVAS